MPRQPKKLSDVLVNMKEIPGMVETVATPEVDKPKRVVKPKNEYRVWSYLTKTGISQIVITFNKQVVGVLAFDNQMNILSNITDFPGIMPSVQKAVRSKNTPYTLLITMKIAVTSATFLTMLNKEILGEVMKTVQYDIQSNYDNSFREGGENYKETEVSNSDSSLV